MILLIRLRAVLAVTLTVAGGGRVKNLERKARLAFFLVCPFVFTIWAWGWWWLPLTFLILVVASMVPGTATLRITSAVLAGIALATVSGVAGLPYATLLGGYLYSVVYWVICFILL